MTASSISDVLVFRTGARVTRVAELPAPSTTLALGGLPLSLDEGSVRVEVQGQDPPRCVEVHLGVDSPEPDAELPPAQDDKLLQARLDEDLARALVKQLKARRSRIEALGPAERPELADSAPPPLPVAARVALLRFRAQQLKSLEAELDAAIEALRLRREHTAQLQEARDRASAARNTRPDELRKVATLRLEGGSGPCSVQLIYRVPGARWAPAYSLRLAGDLRSGELELRALVAQRTGEDWSGARLTLSTARAEAWADLPELASLRIGRRQAPPARTGWREPPAGASELLHDYRRFEQGRHELRVGAASLAEEPAPEPIEEGWAAEEVEAELDMMALDDAPMPPPAPMPAAQAAPMAKSSVAFGGIARAGGGGPPGRADRRSEPRRKKRARRRPQPPTELRAAQDQLDYGRLRQVLGHPDLDRHPAGPGWAARELEQLPPGHRHASSEDGFDHAWTSAHPQTVPSDGAWHSLQLQLAQAPVEPRFVCVPRLSEQVFRTLRWRNPFDAPLLRGPCDVLVDGAWLLTTPIQPTPGRGRLELGLGVEQGLKVARNARYREEAVGLFNRSQELHHEVDIEVRNLMSAEATIELRERLPVTGEHDDEVQVELVSVEPPWQPFEQEPPAAGSHRWELQVPAGQARTCSLHYKVEIPAEHELVGGNRREP